MVTGEDLRKAMSKFATGVTLIITLEEDGSVHAMTANAVTSISLDPPLVLVCVGNKRTTYRYIQLRGRYAINVLSRQQEEVASYFAKEEQYRTGDVPVRYVLTQRGTPMVEGCICFLDCEVVGAHDYGDHTIFVGEVKSSQSGAGEPLLFYESRLRGLNRE